MSQEELVEIEMTIEQCKESVALMDALVRLRTNPDWKKVVEHGFLEKEASRLVLALAEPALQTEEHQRQLMKMVDSVGWFRQYLNKIYQMGNHAKRALPEHEATKEQIYAEEQ